MPAQDASLGLVDPGHGGREPGWRVTLGMQSFVTAIGISILIAGCSTSPTPVHPVDSAAASTSAGTSFDSDSATTSSAGSGGDEFSDPFAEPGELSAEEEHDPWEAFNTVMFEFNRKVDKYALKPVAQAYDVVLPDTVQVGVGNFFQNVRFVPRLLNNLFQAKVKGAGIELGRFLINTTVGVGGFFDPANQWWDLDTPDENSGQTLGFYGMKQDPFLVLPFLPPLTLRDGIGCVADRALDPVTRLVFAVSPGSQPTYTIVHFVSRIVDTVNERSLNLATFQGVEDTTIDLYAAVRNAYMQKRA